MWQVNRKYKRDNTDTKFTLCEGSEDIPEHVVECKKAIKLTLIDENRKEKLDHKDLQKKIKGERSCRNSSSGLEQDN